MADEKDITQVPELGAQPNDVQPQDQNQSAQPAPSGPLPQEELADLSPVEDSEKPLAGAHPESAMSDLVPVEGTEKSLSLPKEQKVQPSGVIGPTSIGPREHSFHNWLQDVQADVKNGSSSTWVGAMLKKFGAQGTDVGYGHVVGDDYSTNAVGDFMAQGALGVPKALEGTSEIAEQLDEGVKHSNMDLRKTAAGLNKVIGGVFQTVAPVVSVVAPEALAVGVPAMIAQSQAEKAAKYMGADDDTAELVGNITGLYAGGRIHAKMHPAIERFGVAVNNRTAAEQEYTARSRELETARGQLAEMQQRAHDAAFLEDSKANNPATVGNWELDNAKRATDLARIAAAEAAKNVSNAQKSFEQAQARRADATIQLEKLGRKITASADKTTAAEYESKASEQKKASDLFQKAVPSKGANRYSPEDEDIARAHMEAAKAKGAKIVDLPSSYEAVEGGRQGIEDQLKPHLEKYADEPLTDKPEDSPKMKVAAKLAEMAKVDGNFESAMDGLSEFNVTDPTVGEAQEMLTKLNNYNRAAMKSANNWDIYNMIETKPDFAARYFMADELRDGLYNKLEGHGVEGAREARGETASLIRVRDAIGAQIRANRGGTSVRGSGTQSKLRLLVAKLTGKTIKGAGIAAGAEMGGPVGAVAGGAIGEMAAQPVEDFIAPRDMTRDEHIEKSMKYKGTNRKPVEIKGTGTPAVIPTDALPPQVKLTPESLELTPRENTELHAELAAHYGESSLEESTYQELEKQLRDDVAAKNRAGVALDPAEKTLLTKILKADSADRAMTQAAGKPGIEVKIDPKKEVEILKEADDRAENGEPTKLNPHLVSLGRGDESALVSHSPAMKAHVPAMAIPGLSEGISSEDAHLHEWAHTAIGAVDGLQPIEIRSDLHPKSEKGAGATAVFNGAALRDASGNIDSEALGNQETQWLTQKMAGPASHEVFNGMTREEVKASPATRSDFRTSRAMVREVHPDFTPSQVEAAVDAAYDRARDFLTKPHIADRIRANAAVREEGLSHTLHASHGRVNQFAEDIRNAHNEYSGEPGPNGNRAGEGGEKVEKPNAEGKEKNAGGSENGRGEGTPKPDVEVAATSRVSKVKPEQSEVDQSEAEDLLNQVDKLRQKLFKTKGREQQKAIAAQIKDLTDKSVEVLNRPEEESKITQEAELRVPFKEGRTTPSERTTGEYDEAIKKGGAIPGGIQKGDPEIELPDLGLFHDPTTGSTLALPVDKITAEAVKSHLQKSRAEYLKLRPEESRIPQPGQPGYDEEIHSTGRSNVPVEDSTGVITKKLLEKYGTNDDKLATGFILPDGRRIAFGTTDHADAVRGVIPKEKQSPSHQQDMVDYLNNENAVRTRYRNSRGGKEVVFSVPDKVSEEQISEMRQSIGKMGRNGNAVVERATDTGRSTQKEFVSPADVEPMLREIGAHPKQNDWMEKAAATNGEGFSFHPVTGEAPKDGFMVETELDRGQRYDHPPTANDIKAYVEKNKDILDKNPDLYVGGYKNTLGLSKKFADQAEAEELGKKTNQISIYDVAAGKEIPTGGTGELTPEMVEQSQMSTTPEHQKRVDDAKWEENPNSGYRLLKVTDSDGTPMGAVAHDNYRMRMAHIYDPYLNKGVGKAMYERAFEDAKKNGAKELMSDTSLSKDAARVWDSLAKEGKYNITSEQSNEVNRGKSGEGVLRTQYTAHFDEPKLNPEESQIGKSPKGSSVPLMDNPLPVKGTMENGEVGTLDITKALNAYSLSKNPALDPGSGSGEMINRAKKLAEDEAKYQLAQSKTGTEWYTTEMKDHDKVLQDLRPELAKGEMTDAIPDHPVNLTLFKAVEAILSSGQKPYANVKSAMRAWDHYKETGEFSRVNPQTGKSWGPRGVNAYGNAIDIVNKLIQEKGEKGAADWLLSEHPVKELRSYQSSTQTPVHGKATDMETGAMILGAKRGPFMQNLHGIESKFTADMWVSRTWNRWMGTLDLEPEVRGLNGRSNMMTLESDAPRNNAERGLMKESFEKTAKKLNLTTSSLQAVLWYYEQALYRAHGIPVESWSFSDAAKRVSKEAQAPEEEQTSFDFGANKDKKAEGGFANLAGTVKPKTAGAIHAFDFLKK